VSTSRSLSPRSVLVDQALELAAEQVARPAEVDLEDLATLSAWNAERVEPPCRRCAVLEYGMFLLGQNPAHDALFPCRPAILSPTWSLRLMAT